MNKEEIIDGLEDLIKDRKSFISPQRPKEELKDNIFHQDIIVLENAIKLIKGVKK